MYATSATALLPAARSLVANNCFIDAVRSPNLERLGELLRPYLDAVERTRQQDRLALVPALQERSHSWGVARLLAREVHDRFSLAAKVLLFDPRQHASHHGHLLRAEIHTLIRGVTALLGPSVPSARLFGDRRETILLLPFTTHQFFSAAAGGVVATVEVQYLGRI